MANFRILSLDGGGSWALIQVRTLIDLYSQRGDGTDVTGHQILRKFDLIAANSGGAITLGGLTLNLTLDQLLNLFMGEKRRKQIFVAASFFEDPIAHLTGLAGIGPKYSARAKLVGLRTILGPAGDQLVRNIPQSVGNSVNNRAPQFVFCAFDYDINREVFFRSDTNSLAGSRGAKGDITIAEAVHASSNAPVNYFDAPAQGPNNRRYWDGAIGGYNNPVLAGVIEALANAAAYNTDRDSIHVLSIGTGNVALPLARGVPGEDHDLVVHPGHSTIPNDLKKLATSIVDDPPDAATFHAHILLNGHVPSPNDPLPVISPIVRLNPLIQPIPGAGNIPWVFPNQLDGRPMDRTEFAAIRDLDMDAVEQPDVVRISNLCNLWFADNVPNQPIRANSHDLTPEIGHGRYKIAKQAALQLFP